jgi:hypothetical protein
MNFILRGVGRHEEFQVADRNNQVYFGKFTWAASGMPTEMGHAAWGADEVMWGAVGAVEKLSTVGQ